MAEGAIINVPVEQLLVSVKNPRYDPQDNQREAIARLAKDQGTKLVALAEDILHRGLDPTKNILVKRGTSKGTYVVDDGNRRIVALKLLKDGTLAESLGLPASLASRFKKLAAQAQNRVPAEVRCVLPTDDPRHWISLAHTGENEGRGTVEWDGLARHRFRGKGAALEAIDYVRQSDFVDKSIKDRLDGIAITNLERVLITPDASRLFGVTAKDKGSRLSFEESQDSAVAKLAILVADIAERKIPVKELYNKDDRVKYAKDLLARHPIPTAQSPIHAPGVPGAQPKAKPTRQKKGKSIKPSRKTLIPSYSSIAIPQSRINNIYHELQRINVDDLPNSVGVLFRVFLELSIDHYVKKHKIPITMPVKPSTCSTCGAVLTATPRDMNLSQKIKAAADDMVAKGTATKKELMGVHKFASAKVVELNQFVHNMNFNPRPDEMRTTWDDVEVFVQRLWS